MSAFTVVVDKDAFWADVQNIVNTAPAIDAIKALKGIKYPDDLKPPALWQTLNNVQKLISTVTAAVEVVKRQLISTTATPSGTTEVKFDKQVALETAVKIVTNNIQFGGWQGAILNKLWGPILNLVISIYVGGKSPNWLDEARGILGFSANTILVLKCDTTN